MGLILEFGGILVVMVGLFLEDFPERLLWTLIGYTVVAVGAWVVYCERQRRGNKLRVPRKGGW
jgi:hypothetical protein